jgi:hypothetical protein
VPPESKHREQAGINRAFAESLVRDNPSDPGSMQWAVTSAFYCAVHCIEAHFDTFGIHSSAHTQRETRMAQLQYGIPPDVHTAYIQLRQWSEQGRYRMRHFKSAMVQQTVLGQYLPRVTRWIGL